MKWIDNARQIHDSLPDVSGDPLALTGARMITPHEAKAYLDKNLYGLSYDVKKFLDLRKKLIDGSLGETEDVIAIDIKGVLVAGVALLLAIADTGAWATQVVSTNVRWDDDPRNFSIATAWWVNNRGGGDD
jgi:hypothetical protein